MEGAKNYYKLFNGKSQRHGRLFLQFSSHARGKCFEIYLLPAGVIINDNNLCIIPNVVCVYGVVGGQRGWSERYGWLHQGKWQHDFDTIVAKRKKEIEKIEEHHRSLVESKKELKHKKIQDLLDSY